MNAFSVLLGSMSLLLSVSNGCTITAKAYGGSSCAIKIGSDTFGDDAQNTCFSNNVGGYSTWYCDSSDQVTVTYADDESSCSSGSFSSSVDYTSGVCTYSDARGFYVKVTWTDDCCSSDETVLPLIDNEKPQRPQRPQGPAAWRERHQSRMMRPKPESDVESDNEMDVETVQIKESNKFAM